MIAETYLMQALRAGINSIHNDSTQLADILVALNTQELASAQQWFASPKTVITIAPGFPLETTSLPFIGVTIADESQIEAQTPIGLDYYTVTNSDGSVTQTRGARFSGSLKATIYTPDANLVIWISAVCKWALLAQYDWFGEQGFNNMNTGVGDFEPLPGFLPIIAFARGIFFRAEYDFVFRKTPQITPITSIIVQSGYTPYDQGG